ncbi:MAG TPA: ABC transporter substrate-binding protein, partial [Terriglobales bacterium]|nr:ABC transporter substrate-binding protein [Terriglobales bacterium]
MKLKNNPTRRDFLKQGALAALSVTLGSAIVRTSYAASRERLTILSSIALETLHPYAHSSSPHYGIWNNMIEPLVEVNYAKREYFGVLAESWQFQGKRWVFKLRKNVRFHDGSPFTAK